MSLVKLAGNAPAQLELAKLIAKTDKALANDYLEFCHGISQVTHARGVAKKYGIKYKPGTSRFHYDYVGKEYAKQILPKLKARKELLKNIVKGIKK